MKQAEQSAFPNYESSTLPYVCWYQNDFLGGVRGMRAHEIGIYTILLNEMYARGRPLDLSEERLARLCGCDKRTFTSVLEMLIAEGKILNLTCGLWNKRCENVFRERAQLLEQKSSAGRSSAQKRKKINEKIQHLLNTCPTDGELNSKAQKEEKETPNGVSQKKDVCSDTKPHFTKHLLTQPHSTKHPAEHPTEQTASCPSSAHLSTTHPSITHSSTELLPTELLVPDLASTYPETQPHSTKHPAEHPTEQTAPCPSSAHSSTALSSSTPLSSTGLLAPDLATTYPETTPHSTKHPAEHPTEQTAPCPSSVHSSTALSSSTEHCPTEHSSAELLAPNLATTYPETPPHSTKHPAEHPTEQTAPCPSSAHSSTALSSSTEHCPTEHSSTEFLAPDLATTYPETNPHSIKHPAEHATEQTASCPSSAHSSTALSSSTPLSSSAHSSTAKSLKGHRLPANWVGDIHAAISEGLSEEQARWQEKKFRDYWHAKSGKQALKVDWSATWRNWYRREIERLRENQERLCALSSGSNTWPHSTQEDALYRNLINYQAK